VKPRFLSFSATAFWAAVSFPPKLGVVYVDVLQHPTLGVVHGSTVALHSKYELRNIRGAGKH